MAKKKETEEKKQLATHHIKAGTVWESNDGRDKLSIEKAPRGDDSVTVKPVGVAGARAKKMKRLALREQYHPSVQ